MQERSDNLAIIKLFLTVQTDSHAVVDYGYILAVDLCDFIFKNSHAMLRADYKKNRCCNCLFSIIITAVKVNGDRVDDLV